jgi:hypothetical protein
MFLLKKLSFLKMTLAALNKQLPADARFNYRGDKKCDDQSDDLIIEVTNC